MSTLSDAQCHFFHLLEQYPRFTHLWNKETCSAQVEAIGRHIRGDFLSPGERTILKVLYSIWCGRASQDTMIDFTDLGTLDLQSRDPLLQWIVTPCWP